MLLKKCTIILFCGLLTSCMTATHQKPPLDGAEVKLAEAAVSVSDSLTQIAAIEQAANPQAKVSEPPNPASYGMGRLVSIDWSGPIEPLVARIAHASGYRFRALGVSPAIPIIITLSVKNVPMGDVLRDVGYQANNRTDIVVYPRQRVIELHYSPP